MTDKSIISTTDAPAAIGPYEQAVVIGDLVFCSGQIALTPEGKLIEGDAAAQAEQVLANLNAVLKAAGSGLDKLVRTTVFLRDMADFNSVNDVYARLVPPPHPARACVEVSKLPRDVLVEIDGIATR